MELPGLSCHTLDETILVTFLKYVADNALSTIPGDGSLKPRNRFAAPTGDHHGVPVSCKFDGEAIRPDFVVLPLAGFSDAEEPQVEEAYVNFTPYPWPGNRIALAMRGMILFKYSVSSEESNVRNYC